jgi:ATP-dependent RNA helicase SUPV3L1/SUV3
LGEVVVEGHPVGHIAGFAFLPDPLLEGAEKKLLQRAARRALREEMPRRVSILEKAQDIEFMLTADHAITWKGNAVARLKPGPTLTKPTVEVLDSEFLDGAQRERVRQRLSFFMDTMVTRELAPLFRAVDAASNDAALRGPLHRLLEAGGVVPGPTETTIPPALRPKLKGVGVRAGRFALFVPDILKPKAALMRARLWAVQRRVPLPDLPAPGLVSVARAGDEADGVLGSLGWLPAGPVFLRLDIAEKVAAELAYATRLRPAVLPPQLGASLGLRPDMLAPVLRALGLRLIPAPAMADDQFGPPSPPMIGSARRRHEPAVAAVKPPPPPPVRPDSPFAALAALRR